MDSDLRVTIQGYLNVSSISAAFNKFEKVEKGICLIVHFLKFSWSQWHLQDWSKYCVF